MNDVMTLLGILTHAAVMVLSALSTIAGGPLWLILYTLAGVTLYSAVCWFWPYTACSWCEGKGKHRSPSGKNWRPCWRCKGSGRKLRRGRRMMEWGLSELKH
jgi:hypothetical protein